MNARLLAALGTGIVSQVLALRAYMLLSRLWPDNSSKYIGFIILAFGSVFAV